MAQAKIYWDLENYSMVEKIFRKSVEFCNDHDVWKLNVAHVLFMQESKYKEAISFYEPIVKKHFDDVIFIVTIDTGRHCDSACKSVCFIYHDKSKRRSRRFDEKNRKRGRTSRVWGYYQKNISSLYCESCYWDIILRQRKLWVWYFTNHEIAWAIQQKGTMYMLMNAWNWYMVLCQEMLCVVIRDPC